MVKIYTSRILNFDFDLYICNIKKKIKRRRGIEMKFEKIIRLSLYNVVWLIITVICRLKKILFSMKTIGYNSRCL